MKVIVPIFILSCLIHSAFAQETATFRIRGRVPASVNIDQKIQSNDNKDKVLLNVSKEKYTLKTQQNSEYQLIEISFH